MVRAGVVDHPQEWTHNGYHEMQKPKERYGLIAIKRLMRLLPIESQDELKESHRKWIEKEMKKSQMVRQSKWTQSIAVGDKSFVEQIRERLGIRSKGRKIFENEDDYQLRDGQISYGNGVQFNSDNLFHWDLAHKITDPHIP